MNPEILLVSRLVIGVATILMLGRYYEPEARFRLGPSVLAGICMVISAALTVPLVLQWDSETSRRGVQFALFLVALGVFLPVAWAKGDMAKVYDVIRKRRS